VGYKFANGFEPMKGPFIHGAAVFFQFKDFVFAVKDGKLTLARAGFDARIIPILKKETKAGGYLPDYKKIDEAAGGYEPYEAGAQHVADNIDYYLHEEIVHRAMKYGEVAAFFRSLQASGVKLEKLAASIEASVPPARTPAKPESLEVHWLNYLREIQTSNHYANWSAAPYDLYLNARISNTQ
jgi:hypothetical protein